VKLQRVDLAPESLELYEELLGCDTIGALREAASPLRGARIAHVNATSYGGGVSELLRSLVPLYRALGVEAEWLVIVAGRAGGIPMQMPQGVGGYLVDGIDECAARTVELIRDPHAARALGVRGREHVRANFLVTRLLTDELRLLDSLCAH